MARSRAEAMMTNADEEDDDSPFDPQQVYSFNYLKLNGECFSKNTILNLEDCWMWPFILRAGIRKSLPAGSAGFVGLNLYQIAYR